MLAQALLAIGGPCPQHGLATSLLAPSARKDRLPSGGAHRCQRQPGAGVLWHTQRVTFRKHATDALLKPVATWNWPLGPHLGSSGLCLAARFVIGSASSTKPASSALATRRSRALARHCRLHVLLPCCGKCNPRPHTSVRPWLAGASRHK